MEKPDRTTSPDSFPASCRSAGRVLVCSIPKAGTYLLAAILKELGLEDTRLHISREEASIHHQGSLEQHRTLPEKYRFKLPVQDTVPQIGPNQYAVSHLPFDLDTEVLCRNLRALYIKRDLRDCVVSFMRFVIDTGRDNCTSSDWIKAPEGSERLARFLEEYRWYFDLWVAPTLGWQMAPNVITVAFESLMGDFGRSDQLQTLSLICRHIGLQPDQIDMGSVIDAALNTSTMTWSGRRSNREQIWSTEVESLFSRFGGKALNRQLGYESNAKWDFHLPVAVERLRACVLHH